MTKLFKLVIICCAIAAAQAASTVVLPQPRPPPQPPSSPAGPTYSSVASSTSTSTSTTYLPTTSEITPSTKPPSSNTPTTTTTTTTTAAITNARTAADLTTFAPKAQTTTTAGTSTISGVQAAALTSSESSSSPTTSTTTTARVVVVSSPTTTSTTTTAKPSPTVISTSETDDPTSSTTASSSSSSTESDETTTTTAPTGESGDSVDSKSVSHEPSWPEEHDESSKADEEGSSTEETNSNTEDDTSKPWTRINMTQVDTDFVEGRRAVNETIDGWHKMNKRLKNGISAVIGSLVPYALNMSQEAKIGSECAGAMLKWVLNMNQLKAWALRMLDASGKPIAGLLEGSLTMFGNYRQCLKIRAPDEDEFELAGRYKEYFRGKYCIVQAKPWLPEKQQFYHFNTKLDGLVSEEAKEGDILPQDRSIMDELSEWYLAFNFVSVRMDLCVPSLCSREDIQRTINYLMRDVPDLKARVLRCEVEDPNHSFGAALVESSGDINTLATESTDPEVAAAAAADPSLIVASSKTSNIIAWIMVPALAIGSVLLATLISFAMGSKLDSGDDDDDDDDDREGLKSRASQMGSNTSCTISNGNATGNRKSSITHTINSLSLKRSMSSHMNVDYQQLADDKPLALYGIRFILVLWVILVESAVNLKFEYLRELLMLKDLIFLWPMQIFINSTLQFDSIILLTAFTMAYKNCLNDYSNSFKSMVRFVIDKYIRLMPSIMLMVAVVILLPLTYKGPVWNDYVLKQSSLCQSNGWLNTLFVQNNLPYKQMCLPQTWLMCVEMQLVILTAPLLYLLNRYYMSSAEKNKKREHNQQQRSIATFANNHNVNGMNNVNGKTLGQQRFVSASVSPISSADWSWSQSWRHNPKRAFYWLATPPGFLLLVIMLIGAANSFYNVYSNNLPPSYFYTMADPDTKCLYFTKHMMRIFTHLAVFCIGLIGGLECRRAAKNAIYNSQRHKLRKFNHNSTHFATRDSNLGLISRSSSIASDFSGAFRGHKNPLFTSSLPVIPSGNCNGSSDSSSININCNGQSQESVHNPNNDCGYSTSSNAYDESEYGEIIGSRHQNPNHRALQGILSRDLDSASYTGRPVFVDVFGCVIAFAIMGSLIFSTHQWSMSNLPSPAVAGLFDIGSRGLWSLALVAILYFVSVPGRNRKFSLLARALGHPGMVCLGKLSFLIYLIYPFVHTAVLAIQEQPIYSSWLMLFHILLGNITITVILSSLVSLFVEMPCRNLFRRCGTSLLLNRSPVVTIRHNHRHQQDDDDDD